MKEDIFQWLAEPSNESGDVKGITHVKLQVLRRAVDPAAAMTGGPEFEVTDFTVESLIRAYFVTASSMILDKLVTASNAHRKELYAAALKENETRKTGTFIDLFSPAVASGQSTTGGMCFLEPYTAVQDKLVVSGTSFPSQGDRSAKRLRMTIETPDGIAPASFTCDHPTHADYRLLAGDLSIGNPAIYAVLAAFTNALPVIELDDDLHLPVVLVDHDVETICAELGLKQQTMLPLWQSRVVEFVRNRIAERRDYVTSIAETEAVCHRIDQAIDNVSGLTWAGGTVDKTDLNRDGYRDELKAAVRDLRKDPILFFRGPMVQKHFSDTRVNIEGNPFRENFVDGFDVQKLSHFGAFQDKVFTNDHKTVQDWTTVPMYFTATPYIENLDASLLNTLWNILLNKEINICCRLSDWEKAIAPYETLQTLPIPDLTPLPIVPQPQWSSQTAAPERERQFRLSLMGSPHDMGDVTKTEIDLDSPYKQFELEMHLGNRDSHLEEAMQIVITAIRMVITPYQAPVEMLSPRDLGSGVDSIIPNFPGTDYEKIKVTKSADRFPAVFNALEGSKKTAALAAFLYQHAAMQASKPFGSVPPSYQELKTLIASSNPFPLPEELRKSFDIIATSLREKLKKKFDDCIYLTQNPSERSTVQPFSPLFVQFTQTTSKDKLNWVLGTEATPVLESVILALHIVAHFAAQEPKNTNIAIEDVMMGDPLTVDLSKPLLECAKPQRSMEITTLFQTRDGVLDCTEYASYLGLKSSHHYLRAGRGFFASVQPKFKHDDGVTGCFVASPKSFNTTDIAGKRCIDRQTLFMVGTKQVLVPDTDGKFTDVVPTLISCYEILGTYPDKFDIKDSYYTTFLTETLQKNTDFIGPISLPIYNTRNDLVGYAYFEHAEISNCILNWETSTLTNIICTNSTVLRPLYDTANRTYYYFNEDLYVLVIKSTLKILKNTPAVYRAKTPPDTPVRQPAPLPFKYNGEEHVIEIAKIVDDIVDGVQGVHYTNARALSKTVFAGLLNTKSEELITYLHKDDPRYTKPAPKWTYDLESGEPMATVLAYLNGVYEQSVTRSTEMPLCNRVCVDVRGPSPDCLATSCFVGQHYYKSAAYLNVEQLLLERCQKTLRETHGYPPGSTDHCLARQFRSGRKITSVDTIVHLRPDVASFVASILYDLREKQSIIHSTQKARNTPALVMNAVAEMQKIQRLLFYC